MSPARAGTTLDAYRVADRMADDPRSRGDDLAPVTRFILNGG